MKIIIDGAAELYGPRRTTLTSTEIAAIGKLDRDMQQEELSLYLDVQLADLGVIGGKTRLVSSETKGPRIQTIFFAPLPLTSAELWKLRDDTIGQWEDGIGENGFDFQVDNTELNIRFRSDFPVDVEQVSDASPVPARPTVATAARKGDTASLKMLLRQGADVNQVLQGYPALHLAILYGKISEAILLLDWGADPNSANKDGNDALRLCASSNKLDDDQSVVIASALLKHGANPYRSGPSDAADAHLAQRRKKFQLAELLMNATNADADGKES